MAISIFFVVCWSPYWIAALYGLYRTQRPLNRPASTTFIYVMYGIHALPYVNSASNWLLYGNILYGKMKRQNAIFYTKICFRGLFYDLAFFILENLLIFFIYNLILKIG